MRIYKYRPFQQWIKNENLTDQTLKNAIDEMCKGLYEANLGSNLYKKRIALIGKRGKRGGYRTIIAFIEGQRAFFIYGFSKKVCDNIDEKEVKIYRELAKSLLSSDEINIQKMVNDRKLFEVK